MIPNVSHNVALKTRRKVLALPQITGVGAMTNQVVSQITIVKLNSDEITICPK